MGLGASGEPQACSFSALHVPGGALSPSRPVRPVAPRCPPVACRNVRPLHRGNMPEIAALPVGGSLETEIEVIVEGGPLPSPLTPTPPGAMFFAGGLNHAVQIAATVPGFPRGFPSLQAAVGRCRRRPPAIHV
ncbi:hypothetical protein NDU88_002498 [Pleurodeles waltl]|uniref:Uncharacterized protein n=1 Tax=Pleurodeles waltl TaxID=8319 RepID=A0AAV7SEE0_PLEWA|nr:hypothetical protein NDU88_002498 [Pleurodeles waltl]